MTTKVTLREGLADLLEEWEAAREAHARQAAMIEEHTGRTDTQAAGSAAMLQACINELKQVLADSNPFSLPSCGD